MTQIEQFEEVGSSTNEKITVDNIELKGVEDVASHDQLQQHDSTIPSDIVSEEVADPTRRSTRKSVPYGYISRETPIDKNDNSTFEAAMNGPDKILGKKAMDDELEVFTQHNVGTLVDKSPDANVWGVMWIFSGKRDEHHRITKYKAC